MLTYYYVYLLYDYIEIGKHIVYFQVKRKQFCVAGVTEY